jgi:hypothetical protein
MWIAQVRIWQRWARHSHVVDSHCLLLLACDPSALWTTFSVASLLELVYVCRHRCLAVTAYDCRRPAVAAAARTCMRADAAATVLRVERRFRACVHLYIGRRRPGKTKDILSIDRQLSFAGGLRCFWSGCSYMPTSVLASPRLQLPVSL